LVFIEVEMSVIKKINTKMLVAMQKKPAYVENTDKNPQPTYPMAFNQILKK